MKTEKEMATHSSTFAWKIPWAEEPDSLQSMGSLRVGHDWVTSLSLFTFMHWRRKWQPTPVFLPGESQGREPHGLPSMGSHRVGHDWSDLVVVVSVKTDYRKHICLGLGSELKKISLFQEFRIETPLLCWMRFTCTLVMWFGWPKPSNLLGPD